MRFLGVPHHPEDDGVDVDGNGVAGERGFGGDAGDADALVDIRAERFDDGNDVAQAGAAQADVAAEAQDGDLFPLPHDFDREQKVEADQGSDDGGSGIVDEPGYARPITRLMANSRRAMPLTSVMRILAMTISLVPDETALNQTARNETARIRQQVAQSIDQIFEGESGGAGAGGEFSGHLAELAFAFGGIFLQLDVGDESAGALMGFEQAAEFELAIGAHDGVGIDFEIDGELADGGELIAGGQRAGGDAAADLVDQLAVDGDAAVQVDGEAGLRGSVVPSHACQCTTLLVHYVKQFFGRGIVGGEKCGAITLGAKKKPGFMCRASS